MIVNFFFQQSLFIYNIQKNSTCLEKTKHLNIPLAEKVEEEDYITRRRRERAEQEKLASANSFRSRSVQPESSSSGYESTPEMKSYERYSHSN